MRKDKIMNQLQAYKSALEEKGYKVVYIGLYGSQNYNLQDKKSDIDAKAIVIPSLKEIVFKQNISRIETFRTVPSLQMLLKIGKALDLSLDFHPKTESFLLS